MEKSGYPLIAAYTAARLLLLLSRAAERLAQALDRAAQHTLTCCSAHRAEPGKRRASPTNSIFDDPRLHADLPPPEI